MRAKVCKYISYYLLLKRKPAEITRHISGMTAGIDVGAGAGQYTAVLNSMGYSVVAVEPDEKKIGNSGVPFVLAIGQDLPFSDSSYDFAFAINVLHHTRYRERLLRELGRVASRIIVSEVDNSNIFVRLYNRMIGEPPDWHLTKRELTDMITRAGLNLRQVYSKGFLGIPHVFLYAVCDSHIKREAER